MHCVRPVSIPVVLAALAAAPWPLTAQGAIFTVGSPVGPGQCSHGTIASAIAAAEASPGFDTVRLTRSLTYEPEAVTVVTSQDLNIVGGFATCTQTQTDNIPTVVSGGLSTGDKVFRITANGSAIIKLRHLTITGGEEGGIGFTGTGVLQTIESTIENNLGTGIVATATGSDAELVLDTGTVIANNEDIRLFFGVGGVSLEGPIEMTMIAPQTIVAFNQGGRVGGVKVGPEAHAYIGSPGLGGVPAIFGNFSRGLGFGGVFGAGGVEVEGVLKLFTTVATTPVRIRDNSSPDAGGLWVRPQGRLCAWNFVIDDNSGGIGSAIHANGGSVTLNRNTPSCTPHPAAVSCAPGTPCNLIAGNIARDVAGNPTAGAAIAVSGGDLGGQQVQIRDNIGAQAVGATNGNVSLSECLMAGNTTSDRLVDVDRTGDGNTSSLYLSNCTIAGNQIAGASVIRSRDELALFNSIIDQPDRPAQTFLGHPDDFLLGYLLLSNAQGVPFGPTIVQDDPQFVAPAAGDYHLRQTSPGIDFAPGIVSAAYDLDGNPRDIDLPDVANRFGPRDLGAYEWQVLLRNGDFDIPNPSPWTLLSGVWDGIQNASGPSGSGSWSFSGTGLTQPRVDLLRQCVRLPGPGRYRLGGWGRGGGDTIANRDYAVLAWEFRRVGTAGCNSGAADSTGEFTLGYGTTWRQPTQPATVAVSAADWSPTSSITVTLTAVDGGITSPRSISAWFDGITLTMEDESRIFADGFDSN